MNKEQTLVEYLATYICEAGDDFKTENFAEELTTALHEACQDKFYMSDNEWNSLNAAMTEFVENKLFDEAKKLAKEWAEDGAEYEKERAEARRGQY